MVLDKCGHTATLKLMAQRPTIHYTSVKLRDLEMGETVWLTTMECSLPLQTGTMMSGPLTVQAPTEAVDGGTRAVIFPSWPVVIGTTGCIGERGIMVIYTILLLRWDSAQRAAKQSRPATKAHSETTNLTTNVYDPLPNTVYIYCPLDACLHSMQCTTTLRRFSDNSSFWQNGCKQSYNPLEDQVWNLNR